MIATTGQVTAVSAPGGVSLSYGYHNDGLPISAGSLSAPTMCRTG